MLLDAKKKGQGNILHLNTSDVTSIEVSINRRSTHEVKEINNEAKTHASVETVDRPFLEVSGPGQWLIDEHRFRQYPNIVLFCFGKNRTFSL